METLAYLYRLLRWYDILDIVVVTYCVTWLYLWVKGTRAFRVLLGLSLLVIIYLWAVSLGMVLTSWALQWLGQALLILVIIIFAPEIRQVLEKLNPLRIWNPPGKQVSDYVDEIIAALEELRKRAIGALIVIEQSDPLRELVRRGIPFDSEIQKEVLLAIFQPHSPTHDGAVWIRSGRIQEAGVFLPISEADLPLHLGSRHRAAVGITEISDAIVLVVSEERKEVSLVEKGRLERIQDLEALPARLWEKIRPTVQIATPSWKNVFQKEWRVKLLVLLLVSSIWFALTGAQHGERTFSVKLEPRGLPPGLSLASPARDVRIRLAGPRRVLAAIRPDSLALSYDLSTAAPGPVLVPVDPAQLPLPPEVRVVEVDPPSVSIELEREP